MNLKSGYPFWLIKDGLPFTYPKLDKDLVTDVVIVGAGISGALARYCLAEAGISCVTVDRRTIGLGSTAASTSLLQYEIDTPLHRLTEMAGKPNAERAFHLCEQSIQTLKHIARTIKLKEFEYRNSLYFAAYKKDIPFLEKEYRARKAAGFSVDFLDRNQLVEKYGLDVPSAILSHHGAQTNAYAFAHMLLQHQYSETHSVFDRTCIVKTDYGKRNVTLYTTDGCLIRAKKVVYATGYEAVNMLGNGIVRLLSTYATISEQFNEFHPWRDEVMMWNTADPYLYLRTTPDKRILVGGRDEPFSDPRKRDKLIPRKTRQLTNDFQKLFPDIPFRSEFSWTGTFGATKDGLPFIGTHPRFPHSYFALGFGGNGITFSMIAAEIIRDLLLKKSNKDQSLFAFGRKSAQ